MIGRSQNDNASVDPQQDAPEMIVHNIPLTTQVIVFHSISVRFQYFIDLYITESNKIGNNKIIKMESIISK